MWHSTRAESKGSLAAAKCAGAAVPPATITS